jgi:hypothetical protein
MNELSNFKISQLRAARAQLLYDYCVTIKNKLPMTFASLRSEDAEQFVLSVIICRVPVNSVKLH